jgi:hypothetical protein
MMSFEGMILNTAVVVSLLSLAFTPKNKLLQMQFIILFVQLPTWLLGLSAVELGLIEYPYREVASVNRTSFIFEYLALPVVCVHLNNHYPWQASTLVKAAYFAGISLLLTGGGCPGAIYYADQLYWMGVVLDLDQCNIYFWADAENGSMVF